MGRKVSTISKAPMARILMNAGAKRVSAPAAEVFSEVIEAYASDVAKKAAEIARHSGRKTVQEGDIKIAAK